MCRYDDGRQCPNFCLDKKMDNMLGFVKVLHTLRIVDLLWTGKSGWMESGVQYSIEQLCLFLRKKSGK